MHDLTSRAPYPRHATLAAAGWRAAALASLLLVSTAGCARQGNDVTQGNAFANPGSAQLAQAALDGDATLARELVAAGANPNAVDDQGTPLLQWAMRREDRGAFRLLLELGADPARGDRDGRTALHLAAMGRTPGWMDALLERGMSPDTPNTLTGATPLYDALRAASDDNVERLLRAGARLDVADEDGTTPLHHAARVKNAPMALRFLEAGADPTATDRYGATFDAYLFKGDRSLLTGEARRALEGIEARLRERGITPAQ